jgi:hypothetical protein
MILRREENCLRDVPSFREGPFAGMIRAFSFISRLYPLKDYVCLVQNTKLRREALPLDCVYSRAGLDRSAERSLIRYFFGGSHSS